MLSLLTLDMSVSDKLCQYTCKNTLALWLYIVMAIMNIELATTSTWVGYFNREVLHKLQ